MGEEGKNDGRGNEVRYYLIDRNRTRYIGPFFSVLEVKAHILEETGIADIQKALKSTGCEIVETSNLADWDKQ